MHIAKYVNRTALSLSAGTVGSDASIEYLLGRLGSAVALHQDADSSLLDVALGPMFHAASQFRAHCPSW